MSENWYVYVLKCSDDSYYTGISQDLKKRIARHQTGGGPAYTKKRLPLKLVYYEKAKNHSDAMAREMWLKKRDRGQKESLFNKRSKASPGGG